MAFFSGKRYFNDILWAQAYNNNTRLLAAIRVNLKGGVMVFFSKKIFCFWWRKKNNLIQSFCHIT
jgi:hypothetical protein